ncbi:MAG: hypothetical protein ACXW3Y_11515 [Rhodoplanes sp.]
MMGQHLAEMRPAEIEHAAEIAEGHEYASRRIGRDRDVDATVHALQHGDRGGMFGEIPLPREPRFRTAKGFSMTTGKVEQPVDALGNGRAVNVIHDLPPASPCFEPQCSSIFFRGGSLECRTS